MPTVEGLYTKKLVAGPGFAVAETTDRNLYKITADGVRKVERIGDVDAVAISSKGTLLVLFRNKGVYELTDSWHQILPPPEKPTDDHSFAYLAERAGAVALAIDWHYDNYIQKDSALYLSRDGVLVQIDPR